MNIPVIPANAGAEDRRKPIPLYPSFLCGFAASREQKEKWVSREAAKPRRGKKPKSGFPAFAGMTGVAA
jgi:hypothetical protein